jgi:hypothetical protein
VSAGETEAFGLDPANCDVARPRYPDATWIALRDRCELAPDVEVLEVGARRD